MIELVETVVVERTLEDCFRYVLDFSTIEQWDPGVYRAVKVTPGLPGVGTSFDLVLNSAGRRVPMRYELVEVVDKDRVVIVGEGDGFSAHDTISFRKLDEGRTEIHYVAKLTFGGVLGVAGPALKPWLKGVGRKAVAGLERALTPAGTVRAPSIGERLASLTVLPEAYTFTEKGYLAMEDKGLSEFIDGKTVVITGPTSGLGLASACELARLGGRLILVGRGSERLNDAAEKIITFSGCPASRLHSVEGDLSVMSEVRRVAEEISKIAPVIDVLINNAGALFGERRETQEGYERSLAINLLCPYVLTKALLPNLKEARGRVINVASGGMYTQALRLEDMGYEEGAYDGAKAYARAKRGLVALTEHWAEHWAEQGSAEGITFNSMHPGWAATPGVEKSLPTFDKVMKPLLRDSRMGADTIVWLASSSTVEGRSGLFWLDRRPRPTEVLPGTSVSREERDRLVAWLETEVG